LFISLSGLLFDQVKFAYLYEDQVFDLSWRDDFIPQFEQFLTSHVRRVKGNVIIYDMLGFDTITKKTMLDAGCYNNGY
jgi:hypothetical protein